MTAGDGSIELFNFIIKTTKEMSGEHGSALHLGPLGRTAARSTVPHD